MSHLVLRLCIREIHIWWISSLEIREIHFWEIRNLVYSLAFFYGGFGIDFFNVVDGIIVFKVVVDDSRRERGWLSV